MTHKSFMTTTQYVVFPHQAFCLSCLLWVNFFWRNWSFKANKENQGELFTSLTVYISVWLKVNVFSIVSRQGRTITSTFPALGITESLSLRNIWYALTLMLQLIIPPVCYHFNTFIRIYWNFMNAVRWAYRLLGLCTAVIIYPPSGSGKSDAITWPLVSHDFVL